MEFSSADIETMLKTTGQPANIEDGSLSGLPLSCKFINPERIVTEYEASVQMTAPSAKVSSAVIAPLVERGIRDRRFRTGGNDYLIKKADKRSSGMTILQLEDA